jgi:acyl dehydratase
MDILQTAVKSAPCLSKILHEAVMCYSGQIHISHQNYPAEKGNYIMLLQPYISQNRVFTTYPPADVSKFSYPIRYYASAIPSILREHKLTLPSEFPVYQSSFIMKREEQRKWFKLFNVDEAQGARIPFTYVTTSATLVFMQILSDIGINFKYLRHSRSEMSLVTENLAVKPDHEYRISLQLNDINAVREDAVMIEIRVSIHDEFGELCANHIEHFIIMKLNANHLLQLQNHPTLNRQSAVVEPIASRYQPHLQDAPTSTWQIPTNMGVDFGRISGDMNIVHTTSLAARMIGYSKPFIQGFCIVNYMLQYYIATRDQSISQISISFVRPVFVGDVVTVYATDSCFEMLNKQGKVVAHGSTR